MKLLDTWKPARKAILYFAIFLLTFDQCWLYSGMFSYDVSVGKILRCAYGVAIALVFILHDFSPKMYLVYGVLALVSLLSRMGSGLMYCAFVVTAILALRQDDISDVLRFFRFCLTLFLVISTLCFFCAYFQGERMLRDIDPAGRARGRLGFAHANHLSLYVCNLMMLWVWEKFDSIRLKEIVCLFLVAVAMYAFTDTRAAFLCETVLCILIILAKYGGKVTPLLHYGARWAAPACVVFTLVTSFAWLHSPAAPGKILKTLNRLFSDRIYLSAHAFNDYGFTLFGQPMSFDSVVVTPEWPTPLYTLDNVYAYFFCHLGAIWVLLICLGFYKLGKLRDARISSMVIMWALYGLEEYHVYFPILSFSLLLLSILFQPEEELARKYPDMERGARKRLSRHK